MSKTEIIEFIAAETGLTKADSERAFNATLKAVEKGLKEDKKVAIVGFGTWTSKKREAREGINPATKERISIPAKNVVTFKAGSKLKDALN